MNYAVGDILRVDGDVYEIIGKIAYRNRNDNCTWMEYRLYSQNMRREKWLSCDDIYQEYSISETTGNVSTNGYHEVDRGTEEVTGAWGSVDVEIGDWADFTEFEDVTEEKIISWEVWDDGKEVSVGYYLDPDEIQKIGEGRTVSRGGYGSSGGKSINSVTFFCVIGIFIVAGVCMSCLPEYFKSITTIAKYLKKEASYIYVTSITGDKGEKADVYKTYGDIDWAAKDIIDAIDGNTENVQQNTEDGDESVAILTSREYCLIYTSEDGDTLIQISTRKYAYYNDDEPYHSNSYTRRYYRGYYYSWGYFSDISDYSSGTSPYSDYSGDTVDGNYYDTYNEYSDSVRQSSINARSSSGGGTSSGK